MSLPRRSLLKGAALALAAPAWAQSPDTKNRFDLKVASFPSFDEAVKAAMPLYAQVAPQVQIRLSSLSYADHHSREV